MKENRESRHLFSEQRSTIEGVLMNNLKPADAMRKLMGFNLLLGVLAVFGLIRLWTAGASVSFILTFLYVIIVRAMIVPAVVRTWWANRNGVTENDHKHASVRSILVQVFGISTVYCILAVAISVSSTCTETVWPRSTPSPLCLVPAWSSRTFSRTARLVPGTTPWTTMAGWHDPSFQPHGCLGTAVRFF
jgi:hypothetical protein